MKRSLSKPICFFLVVYVFWLVFGVVMAEIRDGSYSASVFGYQIERINIYDIFYQYLLFLLFFIASALVINNNNKYNPSIIIEAQVSIIFAFLAIIIKISKYGFLLLSGDYFSRFGVDANLLTNIAPTIFSIVAISFLHQNKNKDEKTLNKYLLVILVIAVISVLVGSRSTAFYALIAVLAYYFIPLKNNVGDFRSLRKLSLKKLVLCLLLVYLFGQIANIFRWFATSVTFQDSMVAILGDSFPEYRSHALASVKMAASSVQNYSFVLWLENLLAYIFPGFIFDAWGEDRSIIFNQVWKDFFGPIFWENKDALYGIRTGLVGEIGLALGDFYLILFAVFFAFLLQKNKSKIITVTCLAGTIPYGATSIFLLFYCLLFDFLIRRVVKILPRK